MTPEQAESLIAQGKADGVALGRALTVDPDWPRKAEQGEARPASGCALAAIIAGTGFTRAAPR